MNKNAAIQIFEEIKLSFEGLPFDAIESVPYSTLHRRLTNTIRVCFGNDNDYLKELRHTAFTARGVRVHSADEFQREKIILLGIIIRVLDELRITTE